LPRPASPRSTPAPRPQLEVRDLELVLALASLGSTAAAAGALSLTQSAVSRSLTQAEERVGVRLFERSARGVAATAAGQRLIAGAAPMLAQLGELERSVAAGAAEPTRVRLVCECYSAYRWLPSAMAGLHERMPGLEVEVATDHTRAPVAALLSGKVDIALLTTAELPKARGAQAGVVARPLFSDELVFVIGNGHRLAAARALTRDQLRESPLISGNTPPAETRWFLRSVFGRRSPKLQFLRFPLTEAIMDAARAGMGIAVVSEWMASSYVKSGELLVKRLATGPLRRPWRIAYRHAAAATAARLTDALKAAARLSGLQT
jgi:LysR family transcriptional regulator for metE and metH